MPPALDTVIAPLVDGAPDPQAGAPAVALPPEWADRAEEPGQRVSLQENGRTVGSLHVVVGHDEAWLEGLWVQPSARGCGVAESARASGGRRMVLFAPGADGWRGIRAAFVPHPWCPDGLVIVERRLGSGTDH